MTAPEPQKKPEDRTQQHLPLAWNAPAGKADSEAPPPPGQSGEPPPAPAGEPAAASAPPPAAPEPETSLPRASGSAPASPSGQPAVPAETGSTPSTPAEPGGPPAAEPDPESDWVIPLDPGELDPGEMLMDARGKANLSIEQAAVKARIPPSALAALERGEYGELPAFFYVKIYVRRLVRVYGLSKEEEQEILDGLERKWREVRGESDEAGRLVVAGEGSGEAGRLVYRPGFGSAPAASGATPLRVARWLISIALAVLLLAVAGSLVWQWWNAGRRSAAGEAGENPQTHVLDLDSLMPPQQLPLKELPVPDSP